MGRSYFLRFLMISALLVGLCFSQGIEKKEMGFGRISSFNRLEVLRTLKRRALMEFTTDYADPGANTNPRTGYLNSPPPPRPH